MSEDRIALTGLRVRGFHGVLPAERDKEWKVYDNRSIAKLLEPGELSAGDDLAAPDEAMARQLDAIGAFVEANLDFFLAFARPEEPNGFLAGIDRSTMGAAAENRPVIGSWKLAPDEALVVDWRARVAHRYPAAAGAPVARAWAGLYDMTPDAHPIIGWVGDGVYAACGFSGHGFMQSPAVGRAVAEELLRGESSLDLTPYRLERFSSDTVFPENLVL